MVREGWGRTILILYREKRGAALQMAKEDDINLALVTA